jgi:hypothetical protein
VFIHNWLVIEALKHRLDFVGIEVTAGGRLEQYASAGAAAEWQPVATARQQLVIAIDAVLEATIQGQGDGENGETG